MREAARALPRFEIRRFKIRCGVPCGCDGVLGYLREDPKEETYLTAGEFLDTSWVHTVDVVSGSTSERDGADKNSDWTATHKKGYWRDGDDVYRVIQSKRTVVDQRGRPHRVGRRPLPDKRLRSWASEAVGDRAIIGQFPKLPAIICCPACGRPQTVSPPPPAEVQRGCVQLKE